MSGLLPLALILTALGTAVWVLLPLRRPPGDDPLASPDEVAELEARHQQILSSLQDLDFELQTAKLSAEDHRAMRDRLRSEAVDVLRRIDEARPPSDRRSPPPPPVATAASDGR